MHTFDVRSLGDALEELPPYEPKRLLDLYHREQKRQRRKRPLLARLDPVEVQAAIAEADRIAERTQSFLQILIQLKPVPAATPIPEFGL